MALPCMNQGRSLFNPCEFKGVVYLCGLGSDEIEAFCPKTCMFLLMDVRLPEDSACCVFVEAEELIILSVKYVTRWEVNEQHQLVLQKSSQHLGCNLRCNTSPTVDSVNSIIYTSSSSCFCLSIDGSNRRRVAR